MKRGVLLLAALVLVPGVAQADRVDHMAGIAQQAFGLACLEVLPGAVAPGALGESSHPGCFVGITTEPLSRKNTCLLLLHEAGHKAGLAHANHGIMVPYLEGMTHPVCDRFPRLEVRLRERRMDVAEARYDRQHRRTRWLLGRIRALKRILGP